MEVPTSVEVRNRTSVVITWEDGAATTLEARKLRGSCRCAACREPSGMAATAAVLAGDEPIEVADASVVGNYAVNFVFSPDRHSTGIYPFDLLRRLGDA